MKKIIVIGLVLITALSFVLVVNSDVQAMNNESAAMLAGAIAIFGKPVLNAVATEIFYPQTYSTYPVTTVYTPAPTYNYDSCYRPRSAYERGYCDEQLRIERAQERLQYRRGRNDARKYYYEY